MALATNGMAAAVGKQLMALDLPRNCLPIEGSLSVSSGTSPSEDAAAAAACSCACCLAVRAASLCAAGEAST